MQGTSRRDATAAGSPRLTGSCQILGRSGLRCWDYGCWSREVLMERFSFASEVAFVPRGDLLDRVTVAPLTPSISEGSLVQAAIFRVEPGGQLLRHPATFPQILAVLEGSGEVSGAAGVDEPIEAGEAVFWHEAEEHEMRSADGLTALIIEGENLDRFRERPKPAV